MPIHEMLRCHSNHEAMQRMFALCLILVLTVLLLGTRDAFAEFSPPRPAIDTPDSNPGIQCRRAIDAAGRRMGVPDHLMAAIGRIESGRRGADGQINPWPWSINVEGADHVYDTRDMAIAAVRAFQAQGVRSIDVGCMQVNLHHHPTAFATLEQAFDPDGNAAYAARFLSDLFTLNGTWDKATATYHSATPDKGNAYQRKVAAVLAEETASDIALLPPHQNMPRFAPTAMLSKAGATMLGNRSEAARIIPLAGGAANRTLDTYRAAPVRVAARQPI